MKAFKSKIPSSEITPESIYMNRRKFMKAVGSAGLGVLLAACLPKVQQRQFPDRSTADNSPDQQAAPTQEGLKASHPSDELGGKLNSYQEITNYNNFYEFTESKEGVAPMAKDFSTQGWTVEVGGLVSKPRTFGIEDILKLFPSEERIYRLRCVEGWSMVIPWEGFPLSKLLKEVEPTGDAKYVAFQTLLDDKRFPNQANPLYPWPYMEGLRLDEAMNDLAILVTGLYGKSLPGQNGAPLRLAVPWKYGFKSIKSIIKIDLVKDMPKTMWSMIASNEYGFYANVNPDVPHPRWSQTTERRIGELGRRKTLLFNGYADEVASLYSGMDLKANY